MKHLVFKQDGDKVIKIETPSGNYIGSFFLLNGVWKLDMSLCTVFLFTTEMLEELTKKAKMLERHIPNGVHLRVSYLMMSQLGVKGHAMSVMNQLGIRYSRAIAQPMGEQYWFIGCRNVPDVLPEYISTISDEIVANWI